MRRGSSMGSVRGYGPRHTRRYAYRHTHWHQYEPLSSSTVGRSWTPNFFLLSTSPSSSSSSSLSRTQAVGLTLFVGLCVYVVYQLLTAEPLMGGGGVISLGRRCPSDEFVAMLTRHSTPDKFVVLALVDTAFADMAINLYESSLRPNGVDNFLFVGAGRRACEILRNASLPCHHYTEDRATDVASTYQSPDFIRKMNIRTEMILDALSVGFTVLHTDLDVVFIRNPISDLKVRLGLELYSFTKGRECLSHVCRSQIDFATSHVRSNFVNRPPDRTSIELLTRCCYCCYQPLHTSSSMHHNFQKQMSC